jgi:hypothetical protein
MKTNILRSCAIALALATALPVMQTGCSTPPSERVQAVNTLKAVGHTAEAAVAATAQFYAAGKISAEDARKVNDLYNLKFQPAFRVAVNAVNSNLESVATPELIALAAQLSSLVLTFQHN